ncbi:MAG TPA: 2-oxoacid:ferredoxin oxidoreductase subunit beta [Vicinamibacterales bacterium]|nr:2-oxoacid:ferredoxin oxidoreductase subunit beta [Vicinamibacterales bacterium]
MSQANPVERYLRSDRIPHIWCPGCGIGTTVNCFTRAIDESGIPMDRLAVVSGIGCTGRVAGYMHVDSFHTTHGRAIPFATGLKLAAPDMKVVVYSGDGDLFAIGGNHFIHAARRNIDMTVICVNNLTYGMTGGQLTPTTPEEAIASTSPYGNFEQPFNLPYLAESCGAVYVARWTTYHVTHVKKAMREALLKKGFSFVEVISPCPTLYGRRNRIGDGLDEVKTYKQRSVIKNGAATSEVSLGMTGPIVVGKFVDRERPTYQDAMDQFYSRKLGSRYARASQ